MVGNEASHSSWTALIRQFLIHPRSVASIAPSGRQLGKLMADSLPMDAQHVIEIGAGTGAITNALIHHGILPCNLFIVEMNPALHELLKSRYRAAHVVCGDARKLVNLSADWRTNRPVVDAVFSSLGMLTISRDVRRAIVEAAFAVLRPGGLFVQYTYGLACPIGRAIRKDLNLEYRLSGFTWRNLPPARVFIYSRNAATSP